MLSHIVLALSALVGAACTAPAGAQLQPRGGPTRLALLVAINEYHPTTPPIFGTLRGALHDVQAFEEVLRGRFGYRKEDIKVLRNEAATLQGFLAAFDQHLLRRAGPDTEVVLYFVGHGSMVPDPTNREIRNQGDDKARDSTWLLHDSRADGRDGEWDLSDDALFSLAQRLTATGTSLVVISDSCHSGGSLRGADEQARDGLWTPRVAAYGSNPVTGTAAWPAWPAGVPFLDDDRRENDDLPRTVHLAACSNFERAWEGIFFPSREPRVRGAFTYALVDALRRAKAGATWRQLARQTRANLQAIEALRELQTPWTQGDLSRVALGGAASAPVDGFEVRPGIGRKIVVGGGSLHGVQEGAGLRLLDGVSGQDLGSARVLTADYGESIAEWDGEPPDLAADRVVLAHLVGMPADAPRLRVHFADAALGRLLATDSMVLACERAGAHYVLEGTPPVLRTMEGIPVWPRAGTAEPSGDDSARADFWRRGFREEMQFQGLWRLGTQAQGQLKDAELAFVAPRDEQLLEPGGNAVVFTPAVLQDEGGEPRLRIPTEAAQRGLLARGAGRLALTVLEIRNQNRGEAHLAVLCLTENREIIPLRIDGPDKTVKSGEPIAPIRIHLTAPDAAAWPLDRAMRERYLVLFTRGHIDFAEFLAQRTSTSRSADDVPPGLRAVLQRSRTRSAEPPAEVNQTGWGALAADILIERADEKGR